ncbi:uncharacterized protein [Mytilus edulis]|uniref:uncharacterized protein n=1 Tax=Mytilus edulis TaxID=6550 RepID=UPI0039F073AD
MASFRLFYFGAQLVCLHFVRCQEVDPCNTYEWLPYSEYRGTLCPSRPYREICDHYLTENWFRVKGDAEIVTEKVNLYHCATTNPIWMRGLLPNSSSETNATACINKGYSNGGCDEEISIKVKKCTDYFVYFLPRSEPCEAGYCFGINKTCAAFEPCDFYYHDQISIDNLIENKVCDIPSGWYKLKHPATLETQCRQSATEKIWINGTNIDSGMIVDIRLCFQNKTACCDKFMNAQVKNCSGSLVFNITKENNCLCSGGCESGNNTGYNIAMEERLFKTILIYLFCYFVILSRL